MARSIMQTKTHQVKHHYAFVGTSRPVTSGHPHTSTPSKPSSQCRDFTLQSFIRPGVQSSPVQPGERLPDALAAYRKPSPCPAPTVISFIAFLRHLLPQQKKHPPRPCACSRGAARDFTQHAYRRRHMLEGRGHLSS